MDTCYAFTEAIKCLLIALTQRDYTYLCHPRYFDFQIMQSDRYLEHHVAKFAVDVSFRYPKPVLKTCFSGY